MMGMLIQWPTIITALMFPVLIYVYYRLLSPIKKGRGRNDQNIWRRVPTVQGKDADVRAENGEVKRHEKAFI
jgi:hypothetical protein